MLQNSNLKDHWSQITITNIIIVKTVEILWWWFSHSVVSNSSDPMDCSLPESSVHGILQARILEWAAISFLRGSSWPRNQTSVSCIAGRLFTDWAMREALWELSKYDTEKQASAVGKRVPIDSLNSGLPENFICKNRNAVSEMHNNVKKHPKMKGVSAIREHSVNESVA